MKKIMIGVTAFIFASGLIEAHRLDVHLTENPPVVIVEAGYGDHHHGLSGGDVTVYAPGETGDAFQSGKTDPSGRFAFIPDEAGDWRVVVDDGAGHKNEAAITIAESFFGVSDAALEAEGDSAEAGPSRAALPVFWKALIGISLLAGIAGVLYGMKARKEASSKG
jgi:nickel transport protein